jgi:hypothetical protein
MLDVKALALALERGALERAKRGQGAWLDATVHRRLSRRTLLKIGAAASAVAPAGARSATGSRIAHIGGDDDTFTIRLASGAQWSIDRRWFDGTPGLRWQRSAHGFGVELEAAELPGLGMRCDLSIRGELRRGSWMARFEFPQWRAGAEVSLEDWISGRDTLLLDARVARTLAHAVGIDAFIGGRAAVRFDSRWSFELTGREIAALRVNGREKTFPSVSVRLPMEDEAPLMTDVLRRTRLAFAGSGMLALGPRFDDLEVSDCDSGRYEAEFARLRSGGVQVASLWSGDDIAGLLRFPLNPGEPQRISLPIESLRIAQLHSAGNLSAALFAGIPEGRHWQEVGTASVRVAAGPQAVVTVQTGANQCPPTLTHAAVESFVVPFIGADTATFRRHRNHSQQAPAGISLKDDFQFSASATRLDDFELEVARISDGFAGTFRFRNLELRSRRRQWSIAATNPADKCLLEFELGSQHLQEEAIFSASLPGISAANQETLCTPMSSATVRAVMMIAREGRAAWKATDTDVRVQVRRVLEPFFPIARKFLEGKQNEQADPLQLLPELALVKRLPAPGQDLHEDFQLFFTMPWSKMLTDANSSAFAEVAKFAEKDEDFKDKPFGEWRPRSVDAQPTRLVFNVAFGEREEHPFDMDFLLGWTREAPTARRSAPKFAEVLSGRALAADTKPELQDNDALRSENGKPIPGLKDDWGAAATAIELPYRLTISPIHPSSKEPAVPVRWLGNTAERAWAGSHALWHVRLAARTPTPFRALASPDFLTTRDKFFHPPLPYAGGNEMRPSLDAHDRHNLVALSAGYGQYALLGSAHVVPNKLPPAQPGQTPQTGLFVPTPFQVHRMLLTPLGASFDLLGKWDPPGTTNGALTVSRWEHHARIRRDTAVTVEYKGFLMPLGIPAVLIKRTTREFKRTGTVGNESYRAVLVQRYTIRVEPTPKKFPALGQPFASRDWCFESITVEPGETPPLLPPETVPESNQTGSVNYGRQAFWPMVATSPQSRRCDVGKLFEFTIEAGPCAFKAPLVFVDNEIAHTPQKLKDVLRGYLEEVFKRREEVEKAPQTAFGVAKAIARVIRGEIDYVAGSASRNTRHLTPFFVLGVRLAEYRKGTLPCEVSRSHPWEPDGCALDAVDLRFNSEREKANQPPFYPRISEAVLESKLIASISGNPAQRYAVEYHPTYVEKAFEAKQNAGAVFLRFVGTPALMSFGGNTAASGGAMAPTTSIVAISRDHGPVGGKGVEPRVKLSLTTCVPPLCPPSGAPAAEPAAVGGRVGVASTLPGPAAVPAAPAPTTPLAPSSDPVAKFMQGISDPMEYFGNVLGDAKLLGCVRLVDIVKTAMQVSGTRVPRITQEEIFDGLVDVLRPVLQGGGDRSLDGLGKLRTWLRTQAPVAVRAKLTPSIDGAFDSLTQARAEVDLANPRGDRLAVLVSAAAGHLRQFSQDAQALADDPISLLPPAAQVFVKQLQDLITQFDAIRRTVDDLPGQLRARLLAEVRARAAELKTTLERAIEAEVAKLQQQGQQQLDAATAAAYAAIGEWINQLDAEFTALEQAIVEAALDRASAAVLKIAERTVQFRGWYALAREQVNGLLSAYENGTKSVLDALQGRAADSISAIDVVLKTLAETQAQAQEKLNTISQDEKRRQAADAVLKFQRSVVQLREQLFTLRRFLERLAEPERHTNVILAGKLVLDSVQKVQGIVRKTGEVLQSFNEMAQLLAQQELPLVGKRFVAEVIAALLAMGTRAALDVFRDALAGAKVPVAAAQNQIRDALVKALEDASTKFLAKLEQTQDKVETFLLDAEQQLMDTAHRQLGLILSRLMPPAGLLDAAGRWQAEIDKAESGMVGLLQPICDAVGSIPALDGLTGGPLSVPLQQRLETVKSRLTTITKNCQNLAFDKAATVLGSVLALEKDVREVVSLLGAALQGGNLGLLVDQRRIVDELIEAIGLPTKLRIGYEWATDIEEFPRGGGAVFRPVKSIGSGPGKQPQLGIRARTEVDLRRGGQPQMDVSGYIDAFDLHLFGTAPFLIVKLDPVKFTSRSGQPLKLEVRVNDVAFGQALKFVDDLAKFLAGNSGLYVKPSFAPVPGIEIGYRFNKDILQLAAVTLQNVSMSIAVVLPFDNSPARFRVAVGSRQKPVLASVGIYGGGFFVAMTMRADTMELLEASMEYGLVTGVEFGGGLLKGTAKITAGIYIALGASDEITGFFNASGAFSVAHIFTAGASLCVSLSRKGGQMAGNAVYTFEFSLAITEYRYRVNVNYSKQGKSDMDTPADGSSSQGSQQRQALGASEAHVAGLTEVERSLRVMGAGASMDKGAQSLRDINIHEPAQTDTNARAARASPGLASNDIWQAYWAAFSDLDGETVEMCTAGSART